MCIRDRPLAWNQSPTAHQAGWDQSRQDFEETKTNSARSVCLLYTSDAADERSSVDLGGRRIIKKKKNNRNAKAPEHKTINSTEKHTQSI